MAARSIASLTISFGLVAIPVKVYSATESASAVRFKLMASGGGRLRQQYVTDAPEPAEEAAAFESSSTPAPAAAAATAAPQAAGSRVLDFPSARRGPAAVAAPAEAPEEPGPVVVDRADMVKGYEYEKGKFVLFSGDELKALEDGTRHSIDVVAFIPERSVDPIYFDKAYFLAPDKGGAKPYSLLREAMLRSGRCALAKWAFRSKEYVVQLRPAEGGLVLQQLLYADEVRSLADLHVDLVAVGEQELRLAEQLIEQISAPAYDPAAFVDEEKQRILAAVARKVAGQDVVSPEPQGPGRSADVVDLVAALRASLQPSAGREAVPRKSVKRARPAVSAETVEAAPTRRKAARKAT